MKKSWIVTTALVLSFALMLSGCSGILGMLGGKDKWQEQYDLGMRYLDDGDYEEAVLAFTAAIEINPNRPEAYMARAEAYIQLDKYDEALKDYKRAKRMAKKDSEYDDLLDELEDLIEELETWIEDHYDEGGPTMESLPVEGESDKENDWSLEDDWNKDPVHDTGLAVVDAYVNALIDQYGVECCYHIPAIQLPKDSAADMNREISAYLMGLLEDNEYVGYTGNKLGVRYRNILYQWGTGNGMVSVLVAVYYAEYEWTELRAYTVSVETGKQISREELLAAWGLDETTYREQARATLKKEFEGYSAEMIEMIGNDFYEYLVSSTLSDENLSATTPFIGPDGTLCMIAAAYGPAGAGYYWHTYDLESQSKRYGMRCDYPHVWNELPGVYHTAGETTRLVEAWYNNNVPAENGQFSASDQETWEDGNNYYVVVRFQNTDPDYRGEANVLVGIVQVDITTGDMWQDGSYMGRLW